MAEGKKRTAEWVEQSTALPGASAGAAATEASAGPQPKRARLVPYQDDAADSSDDGRHAGVSGAVGAPVAPPSPGAQSESSSSSRAGSAVDARDEEAEAEATAALKRAAACSPELPCDTPLPLKKRSRTEDQASQDSCATQELSQGGPACPTEGAAACAGGPAAVQMPWEGAGGEVRWAAARAAIARAATLSGPMEAAAALEDAVRASTGPGVEWREFAGLRSFCQGGHGDMARAFFGGVLPHVAQLALRMPELFSGSGEASLRALCAGAPGKVRLRRVQVASLLAGAFFCLFPGRSERYGYTDAAGRKFGSFSFLRVFQNPKAAQSKIPLLLHYFERVAQQVPEGFIEYERKVLTRNVNWRDSKKRLCSVEAMPAGTIEESAGFSHVDFANKFVGGGIFGDGAVQEEITFMTHPELIVSRLLCEQLRDNECVVVRGAERFSTHSGYSFTLSFTGDYLDSSPRSPDGLLEREVIAIDAIDYTKEGSLAQFKEAYVLRELNKAFIGFEDPARRNKPVATGNWGCGIFRGNKTLKAIIQLLAASEAGRPCLRYLTFGDTALSNAITDTWAEMRSSGVTVGDVFKELLSQCLLACEEEELPSFARLKSSLLHNTSPPCSQ